jgi:hypothetical protein
MRNFKNIYLQLLFSNFLKRKFALRGWIFASYLIISGTVVLLQSTSDYAQQIPLSVLANIRFEIKKAPFSKMFKIKSSPVSTYAVKDKDYKASDSSIRVFSLWTDAPSQNLFQVSVQYCLSGKSISYSNAYLAEIIILDGKRPLATINQYIKVKSAQREVIQSGEYVPSNFDDPFYDPFWSPFDTGFSYSVPTYIPAVTCSAGSSRFNLTPVKDEIARLPKKTLNVKLIFNNGISQNWQLGEGTVKALKELPTIRQISHSSK